jgi:hypothetical protein
VYRGYCTSGYGGTTVPVDRGPRMYQWIRGHDCTSDYGGPTVQVYSWTRVSNCIGGTY